VLILEFSPFLEFYPFIESALAILVTERQVLMGLLLWRKIEQKQPIYDGTAICHKYVTDMSFFA
jgi:hypothetical protein